MNSVLVNILLYPVLTLLYSALCCTLYSRENLATATLEEIVARAQSAEPATQLAAVQVNI